jgi:hypothetical protein
MALLLRPLYEHWLLEATQAPLPAWKRKLLKQALNRDTALRCLAAELAEFSNETHAPASDKAPDLRPRLVALAQEPEPQRALFPSGWVPAGGVALLLLLALVAVLQQPAAQPGVSQNADVLNPPGFAPSEPTPVPIDAPSPSPVASPVVSPAAEVSPAATVNPSPSVSPAIAVSPAAVSPALSVSPSAAGSAVAVSPSAVGAVVSAQSVSPSASTTGEPSGARP